MLVEDVIAGSNVEPRPYQSRIVNSTIEMFNGQYKNGAGDIEPPARSVMIESPTGSGKTCIALLAAKAMQAIQPDLVVGWVAMRRNLLAQASRENKRHGINVENIHFISMFDKDPSALTTAKRDGKPVILVVDECQHDAASSCAHLHNVIKPDYILGMSATPFRTDRVKLCFDKVIKDAGIHQLIQDGYLSKYHHYSIPSWDPLTVANHYCAEPERWGKSIFYFVNLEQCFELHRIFQDRGVVSDVVTGSSAWEEQLEKFENNETPCLINCMKLTEGFDCSDLATAWVRDSVKGPTMQMGGRAFRICERLPHKNIVQSKNTHWPLIRTALPEQQYLWQSDSWRSLTVNPHLNKINMNARVAIAQTEVEIPKWLLDRKSKKPRRVRF